MSNDDYWTTAGPLTRSTARCDYGLDCTRRVVRVRVKEGETMIAYCYPHYLEAKAAQLPGPAIDGDGT